MNEQKATRRVDSDSLVRLKSLSFLSSVALQKIANKFQLALFTPDEVVLPEKALAAGVHILIRGVVKITYLNVHRQRVTVALLPPGLIPEFTSFAIDQWHFRCEAYSDCRVGSLSWAQFDAITSETPHSALRVFHQNSLMRWCRFFDGSPDVRERLVLTLLQLCSNFGVVDSRGTILRIPLSHKNLAELVGVTRPRITEHLAQLAREHLIIRQGRQLIVRVDKLRNSTRAGRMTEMDSFCTSSQTASVSEGRPTLCSAIGAREASVRSSL